MKEAEFVIVTVDEDGNPTIEVKGVKGGGCEQLTEAIEKDLGKVVDRKTTHEHRQKTTGRTTQSVRR